MLCRLPLAMPSPLAVALRSAAIDEGSQYLIADAAFVL